MTIKQIYKKYEKVMDLLYNLEDDFFYESKTLGKVIELLQVLDLDKEFSLCETRAMNRKPCDNCGLMITKQEFKKNAGLCRDCVEDDSPCEARLCEYPLSTLISGGWLE